jgi:hypothetical protein
MSSSFSPLTNPFTRAAFWGREKELSIIWGRLLSQPPQSVVVVGEPSMGKTRLVKQLMEPSQLAEKGIERHFTFIYLDCKRYIDMVEDWSTQTNKNAEQSDMSNFAGAHFWWDLYNALPDNPQKDTSFPEPGRNEDETSWLDATYEISSAVEKWIQHHSQTVIFILDNFEGVARLPLRNSDRLRSIADACAFILTSRYALYVLYNYHSESWAKPSPFFNIFSDPIYLGLLPEQEVSDYLEKAAQDAGKAGSHWCEQDTAFIRKAAGRHPELLRLASSRMFEQRLSFQPSSETESDEQAYRFLLLRLVQDASPLCKQLWEGLARPELYGLVGSPRTAEKEVPSVLSPYQSTLLDIAHGRPALDTKILFVLEQRGLIERANGKWSVFSEVMQQFVLMQEEAAGRTSPGTPIAAASPAGASTEPLTYLEGKVYDFLTAHVGEVCDKTEIMQAVWGEDEMPSQSALQKIIERIREKIEDDPDSPYKLIAVRGRGYMLRKML